MEAYETDAKPEAEETLSDEEREAEQEREDAAIVARAQECYRIGINASTAWRKEALEDLRFLAGEQWADDAKGQRAAQGRPIMTVNRLPQFVRQITNEQRQSKPSITVSPVDSESDVETAEVLQGVIRNIEYTSNADAAYAAGGQAAVVTGLGYWDVRAEWEDERSFEQKLTISRIKSPLTVVMDPGAKEVAGDDARWVIISTDISKSEWQAAHPGKELPIGATWAGGDGDATASWVGKEGVRIHEYRYIVEEEDELIEVGGDEALGAALKAAGIDISTGAVLASEVGPDFAAKLKDMKVQTRKAANKKALWVKIAGDEIVERGELAGKYLQLVRVVGTELEIDGAQIYEGVIRHAKDTQRALNYYVSAETEAIALAPKAPWLVAEGQIENRKGEWEQSNTRPQAVLTYKPTTLAGQPVPAPQRIMAEANIGAISTARAQTADDLKAVTGIYDAQLGARSNEQSGRAILARQNQGQTANFHFTDNLAMAIRYTGRILVDLIPKIYTGPRVMRIMGDDGEHEMVPVNGATDATKGQPSQIQLDAGRYDVAVSMGPSYLSRRQEAAAQLMELLKIDPQAATILMDLVVKNMDIPGGDAIVDRLQKMLPPQIRPQDDKQPPAQVLSEQLRGMSQKYEQLVQELHRVSHIIETKAQDNAAKKEIALIQAQTQMLTTAATLESKEGIARLDHVVDLISKKLELDGTESPTAADTSAGNQGEAPNGAAPAAGGDAGAGGIPAGAGRRPGFNGGALPAGGILGVPGGSFGGGPGAGG